MSDNYFYENNILRYEFLNDEFTNDLYQEFDLKGNKLGLDSKIEDLLSGEIVNFTENKAALHPKYRKNNGYIEEANQHQHMDVNDDALNNFFDINLLSMQF